MKLTHRLSEGPQPEPIKERSWRLALNDAGEVIMQVTMPGFEGKYVDVISVTDAGKVWDCHPIPACVGLVCNSHGHIIVHV